jgi:hypothetical protein
MYNGYVKIEMRLRTFVSKTTEKNLKNLKKIMAGNETFTLVNNDRETGSKSSKKAAVHTLNLHDENVKSLVGLELPMYAENVEKVLATVGGLRNLQQTHEAKNQFLPVKLRPTEPSCKPLFADLTKTQTILLRVKRTKRHEQQQPQPQQQQHQHHKDQANPTRGEFEINTQVVGLIHQKYVCEGMADFQYLTSKRFYPMVSTTKRQQYGQQLSEESESKQQTRIGQALRPYLHVVSFSLVGFIGFHRVLRDDNSTVLFFDFPPCRRMKRIWK